MTRTARRSAPLFFALGTLAAVGCQSNSPPDLHRQVGQTTFLSSPPVGSGSNHGRGAEDSASPGTTNLGGGQQTATRAVEETDIYRLEGDRLYFLNGYRGLMVFDVSDIDHPRLLGRSPIYGWPVEMIVRNGVATVVVADWFGTLEDGSPFHGSIVRGLDASDPTNIRVLGEARLGGWVRDTRVVGDVLYAVSEDYGWIYGWAVGGSDVAVGTTGPARETIVVSSVSFANGLIESKTRLDFPGWGGIFHVTADSILLAHDANTSTTATYRPARTELLYLDISDPAGEIVPRGSIVVSGRAQGWGADNGRWNVDFADGRTAHVVGCAGNSYWGCDYGSGYVLATADFSNPDAPALRSELQIPAIGWGIAARFDSNRLYLSPDSYTPLAGGLTPFQVYDLTNADSPFLAGTVGIPGTVWNILLAPSSRIFALGNDWDGQTGSGQVSLKYIDAANPASPNLIGTATFGQGWAWTPAAGTFKAFTMDANRGLVVLPFSGWDNTSMRYNNGLQLIEFTPTSIRTAGAANTKGWVERGIFAHDRLVSLSDTSLSVVDFTDHDHPTVTAELPLARNVVAAMPSGATIAEVSSDWWDNDVTTSIVRVLPIADAEELNGSAGAEVEVEGVNAQVFRNGDYAYVVTNVRVPVDCSQINNGYGGPTRGDVGPGTTQTCYGRAQQVQVVDIANGAATLRGAVQLPVDGWSYGWWGWYGCFWYDWYWGAEVVQVGSDALAFRRWQPIYDSTTGNYLRTDSTLYVVDASNPDSTALASTAITNGPNGWWGNMRVVGETLYTSRYEWVQGPTATSTSASEWSVRYYLDSIDLSDRAHPSIGASYNVPGFLVGGSEQDPSIVYTIDYRWSSTSNYVENELDVLHLHDGVAELLSSTMIPGWVGSTFIQGTTAYMSAERYDNQATGPLVNLHAIDLSNPAAPVDRVASDQAGWGWLLGVVGDRAVVTSGWGSDGVDIYRLTAGQAPVFDQTVRTRGWVAGELTRQGNSIFLASGYWGVQKIDL